MYTHWYKDEIIYRLKYKSWISHCYSFSSYTNQLFMSAYIPISYSASQLIASSVSVVIFTLCVSYTCRLMLQLIRSTYIIVRSTSTWHVLCWRLYIMTSSREVHVNKVLATYEYLAPAVVSRPNASVWGQGRNRCSRRKWRHRHVGYQLLLCDSVGTWTGRHQVTDAGSSVNLTLMSCST